MIRGWILFSTLVLSVIFKLWPDWSPANVGFIFSDKKLNTQSWTYYSMEGLISISVAACLLIQDNTPRWLIQLFVLITIIDLVHYLLFFRDEGPGFNLVKVVIFGSALTWKQLHQSQSL